MDPVFDVDFGVTDLAAQFHQDWPNEGTPLEVARAYLDIQTIPRLVALTDDLVFMTDSTECLDYADSLWIASTDGYYLPQFAGMSCEEFLRRVRGDCDRRLRRVGILSAVPPQCCYAGCASDVRREIRHLGPGLSIGLARLVFGAPCEGAQKAVEALDCYADSGARPELAFRLLLRLLVAGDCTITATEYSHLEEIGVRLNYGEFLVSGVKFLIE